MKKGLLSILASALLVVGCQNYDDQFTLLENQITALTQSVAGLAQVQSTLASLSGTVNSLSSTVSGLGDAIDTAVAEGLADIQEDITAIEAAVDNVASSDAVSDLADAVASSQEDLDELLANSSVFTGNVVINNASTLDAFHAMGSSLAIVNGNVDIDVTTAMDIVKVQEVVDQILTTTGSFEYHAAEITVTGVTFNNLSGTQTLTLKQGDGYELKSLVSAGVITLDNTWSSKNDIVDLRELTTLTSINAGTLDFTSATEVHLTKMAYYPGGNLTVNTKSDGVVDLSALTDTNLSDIVSPFTLTIDGPSALTLSTIKGDASGTTKGAITLTNVETVNISNFGGTITLGSGVEVANLQDVAVSPSLGAADDLTSLTIEGVTAYGKTYDVSGSTTQAATLETANFITVALDNTQNDLSNITLTGSMNSVTIDDTGVETLTLDALTAATVAITSNDDLTEITSAASKFNDVTITGNNDLITTALDYDTYTTVVASTATADAKGDLNVNSNTKLASLTVHAKSMNDLDIHTNVKLATISFPFLVAAGVGTTPDVDIYGNAFVASSVTDNYDATALGVEITTNGTTNTGTYTSESGLSSLKTWLDAVVAVTTNTNTLQVWFDTVTELKTIDVNGTVTTTNPADKDATLANAGSEFAALYIVPGVTKVSTMDNAVGNEARTYVFDLKRDGLGNVLPLGSGEGFTLTYASATTVDFKQTSTTNTTVSALVSYMDSYDLSAANLDIEAALDSAERYIYTVNYSSVTNGVTSAGTVSVAGSINATFGTDLAGDSRLLSWTAAASDGADEIAEDLVTKIDALDDYNATRITTGINANKSFYVTRDVSGTETVDRSPLMAAAPALNFVIDAAMTSTTAVLGKAGVGGYETASHLSNTFASSRFSLPNITPALQSNLRITLKGTNGLALNTAVTLTFAGNVSNTAISSTITGVAATNELSHMLLVDGVSIVTATSNGSSGTTDATATTYYVADDTDISAGTENIATAAVTAVSTDRTGWL
ncbi:hypothetical protein N8817_03310 [Flavobacteriaceae bacterium]|nr:hypothetical protein [Flavobacteriaceae bacterium]